MEEQELLQHKQNMIERGSAIIYPQLVQEWIEHVNTFAVWPHSETLKISVTIMEELAKDTKIEEIAKFIPNDSELSLATMFNTVTRFSKRGIEFFKNYFLSYKTDMASTNEKHKQMWTDYLRKIQEQNEKFEKELITPKPDKHQ